ncbi:phosphatidylglycerophosphatase A family protein [Thiovibrio sp. JS02]
MDRFYMALATGCGAGYLPKAPGTWGSFLALPLHLLLIRLSPTHYGLALAAIFLLAVISAGQAEKILDRKDPGVVVIDEVIGMLVALIGVSARPVPLIIGFLLFRFFDIVKPYPIRLIDRRINGGLGIVLDDILAGIFSLVVLKGFLALFPQLG